MKVLLTFLMLALASGPAFSQDDCKAQHFFDNNSEYLGQNGGLKCIELDVRHSVDDNGKEFKYVWNFGDGDITTGYSTEHCYKKFGTYIVNLDLVDPQTNLVIRNELSQWINIFPAENYHIDTTSYLTVNFKFDKSYIPEVQVEKVFWKIEEVFTCGETTKHSFKERGLHMIVVGVEGKKAGKKISGFTQVGIFIKEDKQ